MDKAYCVQLEMSANHPCPAVNLPPARPQNGFSAPDVSYDKCTGCGVCSKFVKGRANRVIWAKNYGIYFIVS